MSVEIHTNLGYNSEILRMIEFFRQKVLVDTERLGTISAFFSAIFGATYSLFGKGLLEFFPSHTLAAMSSILVVFILLLFFGLHTEYKKFDHLSQSEKIWTILAGTFASIIAPLFFLKGLSETSVSNTVLLGTAEPVFTGIISAVVLKEAVSRNQILGGIAMLLGITLVVTELFSISLTSHTGDMFIILACVSYAIANNIVKKKLLHVSPDLLLLIRSTTGGIGFLILLPFFLGFEHDVSLELLRNTDLLQNIAFYIGFSIIMARLLWYNALELIPANKASSIVMSTPLWGIVFAVVFLGETLKMHHLIGGSIIMIGLVLTVTHHQGHKHHHILQKIKPCPR